MKKYLLGAFGLCLMICGLLAVPRHSEALNQDYRGYFTNSGPTYYGDYVWRGGVYSALDGTGQTSKQAVKDLVWGKLYSGDRQDQIGAAYIIETMRGVGYGSGSWNYGSGDAGINAARADFADWAQRLDNPAISIGVQPSVAYNVNTSYTTDNGGDVFAYSNNGADDAMVFYNGGTPVYVIKLLCANPLGDFPGLPPYTPPPSNNPPMGSIDSMSCGGSNGWAFDPDNSSASIIFRVYVNGFLDGQAYANGTNRGDVNTYFGIGGNHGWATGLTDKAHFNPRGSNTIQIRLVDGQDGSETLLGGNYFVGPCVTPTCSASTLLPSMLVGQATSFTISVDLTAPYGPPYNTSSPGLYFRVYNPAGGDAIAPTQVNYTASGGHLTSDPISLTPTSAGSYRLNWTLDGAGMHIDCGNGAAAGGSPNTSVAGARPFMFVDGGDIAVGAGFGSGCTVNDSASIKSWNRNNPGDYTGTGGTHAAQVLGSISGYSTNTKLDGSNAFVSAIQPTGLQMPKAGAGHTNSNPNFCVPDYAGNAIKVAGSNAITINSLAMADLSSPGTRTYILPGNQNITASTVSNGANVTLIVQGDAYIVGNSTYNYNSLTNIPQLRLIVKGDIYIGYNVTEIHGLIDAQGSTGAGGKIFTCNSATRLNTAAGYSLCNNQLKFYGAVAAKQIYYDRTFGTYAGTGLNAPAETFSFSPEMWLSAISSTANPGGAVGKWDAASSLPPVL